MESSDSARKADSGSNGDGAQGDGATGTRRKLSDQQEREVTRLYSETETPVSEISKRFGIGESSVYRVAQRHGAKLRGRTATSSGTRAKTTPRASTPRASTPRASTRASSGGAAGAAASTTPAATGTG